MKHPLITRIAIGLSTLIGTLSLAVVPATALTQAKTAGAGQSGDQAKVQRIINRGNSEISRRLATLNSLAGKINTAPKLSATDKATLSDEVTSETTGLNSLKTKLDADTTVADAKSDAQSIINDYRVYALVMPKANLVRTADDQQVAEDRLSALAAKLQPRISAAQTAGKNVTSLQSDLTAMNAKIAAAQAISPVVEAAVINLQPSDYNTNHSVLNGDRNQLKTAQNDLQAATQASATIVNGLKNL
jgi:hypothetical protein